jgi:glucose-6-phosphate dehydrogenase assembly protein OpcA
VSSEGVWSAQDTSPAAVEAALRQLLAQRHEESDAYVPARVLNLIAIVDREWKGEVHNRLERVGRFHASRTILCAIEQRRTTLDAFATMSADHDPKPGEIVALEERVELDLGPAHLKRLATIVDPLLVPDLITLVWSPHQYDEAVDELLSLAQVVLIDTVTSPEPSAALRRSAELCKSAYVVDLAWVRSMPWRERIAATFDPPEWRPLLDEIESMTVRHHDESTTAAVLMLGWLATRLGWDLPSPFEQDSAGTLQCSRARTGDGREIELRLEPAPQNVPGLAGVSIDAGGNALSLDRGPGGLAAKRRTASGRESSWVVLGASRGEAGILGEGIRQALLRDPTYAPALHAATAMLGAAALA